MLAHFEKYFRFVKVGDITVNVLNQFFRAEEEKYAQSTLHKVEWIVHRVFNRAVENKWITYNPFDVAGYRAPKSKKTTEKIEGLTPEELAEFIEIIKPYPIIYQDLKPEHIILCGKRIVLIDFGISSYITSYGNTFQYFGTEGYAPPEKYQGNRCDIRSDIYGVGKVIAFMASKLRAEEFQFLQPLIEKATAYHMEERYPAVEVLEADLHGCIACGSLNFHNEKSKHLLKEIAVAGTQMRVGTTHIAIALTCFMNQYDRSCVYQEYHESDCMRLLINEDGGYMRNDGMIIYEKFRGIPYYGEGIEKWSPTEELSIQDYGTDLQDVLEENKHLVIVMGCRPWEKEQTKSLLEKISLRKNLVLICNYESSIEAKNIARMYRHRVYSFPLDADPFHMTREKRKLFQKLLRQEGW